MLKELSVKNFAIIEDINVSFNDNMTVLTGETGAGKSLIIDTISLLLGARADSDMIRYNESKAVVKGVFSHNEYLNEIFTSNQIEIKDTITIYREITDDKRNIIKINDSNVTLNLLKQVSVYLADIHIQNDTYRLFNQDSYLDLVDPKIDNTFNKLVNDYQKKLYTYKESLAKYKKILSGKKESEEKLEFLKYEQDELSSLNLYTDIDKELEEKISRLSNFDKISQNLNLAYQSLNGEFNPLDMIYEASKNLEKISEYDKKYEDFKEKLLDTYYISSEISDEISKDINSLDYDEDELNSYIEALEEINKAKTKYKKSVDELIKYLDDITLEIDMVLNYDELLEENKNIVINNFNELTKIANKLSDYRKKIALNIEKEIISECKDLDLENTTFEIKFNELSFDDPFNDSIFKDNGIDEIDFMISFNKGEPVRSLNKVASGGEMSRIMLAFKSYFSKNNKANLMIFDEIDTGVSGSTAKKIANKMHNISKSKQVLCITHLPQVAAIGDNHLHIYKVLDSGRTKTEIKELTLDERIEEIAMMLSGDRLSQYAILASKELLNIK